ncbi:MAG: molybdenum cofactor cytidylyltransferase [Anaerolineales bacterium]
MASDPDLTLRRALRLNGGEIVAFVGAGGKSAAMFQLAREFGRALLTTTTHLGGWQAGQADFALQFDEEEIGRTLAKGGICLVSGALEPDTGKLAALTPEQLTRLAAIARETHLPLLIEADGSRGKPLKAPAEHEPVIPPFVDLVVICAGLGGLNRPLDAETVQRPEIFGALSGLGAGETIRAEHLARVLTHPLGGLKNIPAGARSVILLNQADVLDEYQLSVVSGQFSVNSGQSAVDSGRLSVVSGQSANQETVQPENRPTGKPQNWQTAQPENRPTGKPENRKTAQPENRPILLASLKNKKIIAVREQVAAIVLAAGAASRFGGPKQLLDYHGQPFVHKVAETALKAGLWPVIVVTGAYAEAVEAALTDLPVQLVRNPGWQEGQAASIRAGVAAARAAAVGAALFLLADQPQVTVEVARALLEHHARRLDAVTAPYVFDRRANPVLFDAVTFDALSALRGDSGGRAIFSQFSPRYLTWYDRRLLLDVDTVEEYEKMMNDE